MFISSSPSKFRFDILLIIAAAVTISFLFHLRKPPLIDTTKWTSADLHAHLSRNGLPLRFVPGSRKSEVDYLTTRTDLTETDLNNLPTLEAFRERWKGTVRCEGKNRSNMLADIDDESIPYIRLPSMTLFGDPELLFTIRQKLGHKEE